MASAVQTVRASIAANLRRYRASLGLSQERLAERAGLSLVFVQRIERAETNLSVDALVGLAQALKVDPRLLLRPAPMPKIVSGRPPGQRTPARRTR